VNAARAVVSCIVPVHNGAAFIGEAIESILAQTGPDLDVIVVDDGSTDNSAEIAEGFAGVRVHRRPQGGVASARNDGLALARGDYIAFLDADDLWLPGKLAAQMTLLEASPRADYCLTLVRHVITAAGGLAEGIVLPGRGEPTLGRLTQCLLARRRAFGIVGGFDTGTTTRADQDWFTRAESRLASVLVNEVFTIRRIHGDNHSLRNAQQVRDDFLRIAKRNLDRKRRSGAGVDAAKPRTP
jgi:glycosyltransferase involved in cell wall biosynthesis